MDKNSDYIFKAFIVNSAEYDNGNKDTSGAWLYFPTDAETVKRTLEEIGLPENASPDTYFFDDYICGNDDLKKYLSAHADIDELNYLAGRISELEDIEMTVFQTVIKTKYCETIKDAVNLTYNTECFDIVSDIGSWENVGAYIVEREGLGIGVIGDLSNFIDYAAYARAYANDNGGYLLDDIYDDIYIERNAAELTEKYNGDIETIPPEYLVTEYGKNINFEVRLQASMELAIEIDNYLRGHSAEYVSKYTKPDEPPVFISDCLMNGDTLAIKDMLTETSALQGDALVDKICEFEQKYPCDKNMNYHRENVEKQAKQKDNHIYGVINKSRTDSKTPVDLHFKTNNGIINFGNNSTSVIVNSHSQQIQTGNQRKSEGQKMNDKMKVLVVEPMREPYIKEIDAGLKSLQKEVDGDIQAVYPFEEEAAIICNEEGKINGLELNRALFDDNGKIYDVIAGTFLICGLTGDNFGSLPDDLIQKFSEQFKQPEIFVKVGRDIIAIPAEPRKPSIKEQFQQTKHEQGEKQKKPPQKPEPEL